MTVEQHPLEPFLPNNATVLMLGSFPPSKKRWCMDFFYPNFNNDMWRIFGLVFFDDKDHFVDLERKCFRKDDIVDFLTQRDIALYDTATAVVRTKDTASDKDLEVIEPTDLDALLARLPKCKTIITTGQKATDVLCAHFGLMQQPVVGGFVDFQHHDQSMRLYRMPSSSRAYPLNIQKKAQAYKPLMLRVEG